MPSSYDKIGETLTKSEDWKRLSSDLAKELDEAGITGHKCTTSQDYQTKDHEVVTRLVLSFGNESGQYGMEAFDHFKDFQFPANTFLTDDRLNALARKLFGTKGHPTYFCKLEKLEKKWPEFARLRFLSENKDAVEEYVKRVKTQRKKILASAEVQRDQKRTYELAVIEDIRKVVQVFYRKVGPEVLKEALDGVVMHDIMES
jgi:hypothetical protein